MTKKIVFFLILLSCISAFGQKINLDKYQYIIVSNKFDFLKESDQYQTSSLTKFLLKKKGFQVFLDSETLPKEIMNNRCSALFAEVVEEPGMFITKNSIQIKDCYGKKVYTSKIGKSKIKDYHKAYQDAIRNAYELMEDFVYSYNPTSIENVANKDIKDSDIVASPIKVMVTPQVKKEVKAEYDTTISTLKILYAQSIENGFQLVNTKPEVVFKLLKTSLKEVYILTEKNGVFYKNGDHFIAEYYEGSMLIKKEFQVKF